MRDLAGSAALDAPLLNQLRDALSDIAELRGPARLGVAVSGGGDSLALLDMVALLAPGQGWQIEAITVDHGLRAASATEAEGVAAFCAARAIPHATRLWSEGLAARGNLMEQARAARFRLIGDWARARGCDAVLLGHTAEDQAESFLMNLGRAAGLDGLSGMRRMWRDHGVLWLRPMLALQREALRGHLRGRGIPWVDDPSNADPRYTRVRLRNAMAEGGFHGITALTLATTIRNLASASAALRQHAADLAGQCVQEEAGSLVLDPQILARAPAETRRRLICGVLAWFNGPAGHLPRGPKITGFEAAIADARPASLAGVLVRPDRAGGGGRLRLLREPARLGPDAGPGRIWDQRWRVHCQDAPHGAHVGALGAAGLAQCLAWRDSGFGRAALLVSPALWLGDRLLWTAFAGPIGQEPAGNPACAHAELVYSLPEIILSH